MDLDAYEPFIKAMARRYAASPSEIDDCAQVGRIHAWNALERNPVDPGPYVRKAIKYGIIQKIQYDTRRIRNPTGGFTSYNSPISDDDDRTLENLVGKERLPTGREFVDSVKDELRQKYGRNFLKGLEEERYSKVIVQKIIRTVIEDVEQIPFEEIPEVVDQNFFIERGMINFLIKFYSNSPYMADNDAYQKRILPWEWSRVPQRYWQGPFRMKRASDALEWFANKKEINCIEDCGKIIKKDFAEEGLGGMLRILFRDSTFAALKILYPELRPWNMKHAPNNTYDNEQNRIDALNDYLIFNNVIPLHNLSPEETYDQIGLSKFLTKKSVMDFGLCTLLNKYDRSVYKMFVENFPEQILPWTIKNAKAVWKEKPRETAIKSMKWLFEDYLQLEEEELPQYVSQKLFRRLRFSGIMTKKEVGFRDSPFEAVNAVYPNVYSLDDFRRGRKTVYKFLHL